MRFWDLARAAKAEKVGFWADIAGYFFIFLSGGGARRTPISGPRKSPIVLSPTPTKRAHFPSCGTSIRAALSAGSQRQRVRRVET